MSWEEWIAEWGYVAVFVGAALEGEGVLLVAGYAAHRGYLELPLVVALGFVAALTMDQSWFHLGRRLGFALIAWRPAWMERAARARAHLARHATAVGLGFRFVFGMRTVTAVTMGAAHVPPLRFLAMNLVGAFTWSLAWSVGGYWSGSRLDAWLARAGRDELAILGAILVLVLGVVVVRQVTRRRFRVVLATGG